MILPAFLKNKKILKNSLKILTLALILLASLGACSNYGLYPFLFDEDDVDERSSSVEALSSDKLLTLTNQSAIESSYSSASKDKGIYSVLLITDPHFGTKSEARHEDKFLEWLENRFKSEDPTKIPRFAVNLGDIADGGHRSEYFDYLELEDKIKALAGKYLYNDESNRDFKIYSILGNHDLYNNGWDEYEELIFPNISSYHFSLDVGSAAKTKENGFSYYFLDTANGTLGANQLEDFESKLKEDSRPKIVLTHYPVYAGGQKKIFILHDSLERARILSICAKCNVKQILEGHAHGSWGYSYDDYFREDVVGSLVYTRQCAVFTVNENDSTVSLEIIDF